MKLVHVEDGAGRDHFGLLRGDRFFSLDDAVNATAIAPARLALIESRRLPVPSSGMARWLHLDPATRAAIGREVEEGLDGIALADLRLRAPVARPGKIVGVGRNYADHAKETGVAPFEKPRLIFKMPSSVSDPGADVRRPADVQKMDFEAELAVVIGEFARDVPLESALSVVAGYTVLNDLSAREFQFDVSPAQTTFAKSMDGFCPLGPCLVTSDEVPDPQALRVRCWVNEVSMQDASTADMLFSVAALIAYITRFMTLEPGDIIATGTPAGIGAFRTPPQWLQPGDRVRAEVSGIGVLETGIV